jgi:ribosomal protein S18 acetylase RimI-like enzyme
VDTIEVRRADKQDSFLISAVLLEAFLEYRSQYTEQGFAATTPTQEEILKRLEQGPLWLALANGETVGTVSTVLQYPRELYVRGMAVLPAARGLGIGALLFQRVEQYAKENDCNKLILSTTPFLDRAIRLYERLGFVRVDRPPHDLYGTPLFSMEKLL